MASRDYSDETEETALTAQSGTGISSTKDKLGKKKGKEKTKKGDVKESKGKKVQEKAGDPNEIKGKKDEVTKSKSVTIVLSTTAASAQKSKSGMVEKRSSGAIAQHRNSSAGRLRSVLFKSRSGLSVDDYSSSSEEDDAEEKEGEKKSKKQAGKKKKKGDKPGKEGGEKTHKQYRRSILPAKLTELRQMMADAEAEDDAATEQQREEDVMAEIRKMKEAVDAGEALYQMATSQADKKTKKKQAKKPKKPKAPKITPEMAEKMRIEAELEAARQAELERKRLEEERKAAIEKDKREVVEQRFRVEQLKKTDGRREDMIALKKEKDIKEKELKEWELYIACGRLPNPSYCDQMNTYLHLWEKEVDNTTVEEASRRTTDVVKLLADLQDLLDTSEDVEDRVVQNWTWVRQLFRDHQQENLDIATYRLLRNIENNLRRIDIPTADFDFQDENVKLSIWLRVQLPIPLPNPRRPPKSRIEIDFSNVNMQVLFPVTIDCDCMAIRSMYLKYDHLSDLCENFYMPEIPESFYETLLKNTVREWRTKLKYKYRNRDKKDPNAEEEGVKVEEKEKTEFASDEEIPLVPYKRLEPNASETAVFLEDTFYAEIRQQVTITSPNYVINLRKFSILGGVYCLNLIYQPPQPQYFVTMDMQMTKLFLPKKLEHVDFSVTYTPPAQAPLGIRRQPEEIEEEMKQQEEELDKLMLITLSWPRHVIFLELPIVCHWNEKEQIWSKKHIHDLKHNEEKLTLSFRTGFFGTYGLATIRYVNLPYQAWELKPEEDGSVTLQITAAILMLEFNIKDGLICLSQLQNSPNKALTDIVGVYFKLYKLKRMMMEAGIDIFPEQDAFCYVEGACEKQWPMEKHLYYNMAQLAACFNFAWSRWNVTAGRRNIVLQMREYVHSKSKQKNHSMLMVTPLKATFVECTEVSQVFCEDDIEGLKFSADLYHLIKATYSITVRKKAQAWPWENVYTLYDILLQTRVLSFS